MSRGPYLRGPLCVSPYSEIWMSLNLEFRQLPDDLSLASIGNALVIYARSLHPGTDFEPRSGGWHLASPKNFVAFKAKGRAITMSLYGLRYEFTASPHLPLKRGRWPSYCECTISHADHLAAAAAYIQRASELKQAGRRRFARKDHNSSAA